MAKEKLLIGIVNLGRTVKVVNGDIADATKKLDRILNENNVWRELRLTQRHEKKGAKRRRLSSERWRTRFKDEVCFHHNHLD